MIRSFEPTVSHRTLAATISIMLLCVAMPGAALADSHAKGEHAEEPAALKYRKNLMEIIGKNMGAIGNIMKNGLDMPGAISTHAGLMADSAALIAPAFKKKITEGRTDAKPEIWEDWAQFEAAIADFEKAARDLQKTAVSGDMAALVKGSKALGKSCGGCHKTFRKPKEESFHNKK